MLAFLCPGQGAQAPGFLHALPDHPAVKETLAQASACLGFDVLTLDCAPKLRSTVAVQLATVIASVATARAMSSEGVAPQLVAGLSVGSYSAAVIADAIAFPAALELLRTRASLMEQAYPEGHGLAVIVGLTQSRLRALIADLPGVEPVHIANINSAMEFVISGADRALLHVVQGARMLGARRAERLPVAVPSHSPLLNAVADELAAAADAIPMRAPSITYIGNRRSRVIRDPAQVREELARNLAHPVHWADVTTLMCELGARSFLELLPGCVLSGLARAAFPQRKVLSLQETGFHSAVAKLQSEDTAPDFSAS